MVLANLADNVCLSTIDFTKKVSSIMFKLFRNLPIVAANHMTSFFIITVLCCFFLRTYLSIYLFLFICLSGFKIQKKKVSKIAPRLCCSVCVCGKGAKKDGAPPKSTEQFDFIFQCGDEGWWSQSERRDWTLARYRPEAWSELKTQSKRKYNFGVDRRNKFAISLFH